ASGGDRHGACRSGIHSPRNCSRDHGADRAATGAVPGPCGGGPTQPDDPQTGQDAPVWAAVGNGGVSLSDRGFAGGDVFTPAPACATGGSADVRWEVVPGRDSLAAGVDV